MQRLHKMKGFLFAVLLFLVTNAPAQTTNSSYTPSAENEAARRAFQDMKFGMFIHWGASSVLGAGEWVMNNRNIRVDEYRRLMQFFNPTQFSAAEWVATAKAAGMNYITFITRHHDGFSNWDTKASHWKITNTPYGEDVLKSLADECQKQNMKLFLYYSLLDWYRDDYPHQTGRTGQGTGREGTGDYAKYLQFMKTQLTELLTNYGPIAGIWFDGHWDQTAPEGASDRSSRIDWKYDEIYGLIHQLQPQCLIGNNHHMTPFPGEDFQMFERDLPGENKSGLSFQEAATHMPIETCETMNDSWGFNITDHNYKTVPQLVRYLVNAAGRNTNFLLNVGPMPNGVIQQEFRDSLAAVGTWLKQYGESIYGTRGKVVPPQPWGVVTANGKTLYVHVLNPNGQPYIFLPELKWKVVKATSMKSSKAVKFKQQPEGVFVYVDTVDADPIDTIIQLETK
jgi:alpha-L-fucosidase